MKQVRCAAPLHVSRPAGPWHGVRESLSAVGNALVYTTWGEWLPSLLTTPRLRELLGSGWDRFRRTPDSAVRYRFAAARLLVKYAASAATAVPPEDLELASRLGGQPYLRGVGRLELSLSHTRDVIAVALSRTGRIGVDVEPTDRRVRLELLRGRALTPAEERELAALPESRRAAHALRLWTLKEAYSKALGQGMRLGFREFGFGPDGLLRTPDGRVAPQREWGFATHTVLDGYLLSTACHDPGLGVTGGASAHSVLDSGLLSVLTRPTDP